MSGVANIKNGLRLSNGLLSAVEDDVLYHLGLSKRDDLAAIFSGTKFVFTGGSTTRIAHWAALVATELNITDGSETQCLSHTDRYVMYKVGPVLCVNHGIGCPSIAVMLNELLKLLEYAGCQDAIFFRMGTSGGLGLAPGSVVVSNGVLNGELKPYQIQYILGRKIERPTDIDKQLVNDLLALNEKIAFPVVAGITMCADDFYEGQARLDGAFCEYTIEDKMAFLQKLHSLGVCNIEMESVCFAATLFRANVKGAIVCVTLLNRLVGDQVVMTRAELLEWEERPFQLVIQYVKDSLASQN
uniref:Nucleoside phosphorylase domain-containing protein n=1 Tax=Plectus sambesii TaxID=2011161 RepID=A0A914W2C6_9BILA